MWSDLQSPVVIAHRGDSAHAPENTLSAFRLAEKKGADAVEFDVKLSKDRHVIVIHDKTVERTTNGSGQVNTLPLAALKELDAGVHSSTDYPNERIPTLVEVFENLGNDIHMNIELTNYSTPFDDLVERVADTVQDFGFQERILFSSFLPKNLHKAKKLLPDVPCGLLSLAGIAGFPIRLWGWKGRMEALHPHIKDVNVKLINMIHKRGKKIRVWTVNGSKDMEMLTEMGVDGIFTDDPALMMTVLGRVKHNKD